MICKYCDTEHPKDEIANPHYCIARLSERVERLEEERDRLKANDERYERWAKAIQKYESWKDENARLKAGLAGKQSDSS